MQTDLMNSFNWDFLSTLAGVVVILLATAVVSHIATKFLRRILHYNEDKNLPSSTIFTNIVRGVVWVLGGCFMLSSCFHVDVTAAVAALGVGGIALSLGFQDTISNLIGGLQVSLMRIVTPGDYIEVGSESGVVKDVTWRHTTICNSAGERVIIPNSIINKTALVHLPPATRITVPVVVVGSGDRLEEQSSEIVKVTRSAVSGVATLTDTPALSFKSITSDGFEATLTFSVASEKTVAAATNAAIRAIAPLTR